MTKDKVVKLKEVKLERPASVSVEEAGDEGVAKAEGYCGKLVGEASTWSSYKVLVAKRASGEVLPVSPSISFYNAENVKNW